MTPSSSSCPNAPAPDHAALANAIRALAMDAVERAKSGHPGMPMGMADAATVLFSEHLKFDPSCPEWPDRDRFVLSAGHGSMLLYALLYLTGYDRLTLGQLQSFRQLHAITAGHPEYDVAAGIETTTGPLGQGLANAVGMAIAEEKLAARFGRDLVDHRTYCIAGDGCLMEGISHEAASLAGHLGLSRLVVLFDDNGISIDGPTSLAASDDTIARFGALGWHTQAVDGHDNAATSRALTAARETDQPSLIAVRTVIGYGSPNKQGTAAAHGAPLGEAEIALAREALDWPHPPFVVPEPVLAAWRDFGRGGVPQRRAWEQRLETSGRRDEFAAACKGTVPAGLRAAVAAHVGDLLEAPVSIATRVASQNAIEKIVPAIPELFGGSADLTGSNNTRVAAQAPFDRADRSGSYLHYGVREHAMAAAMNGMALHGGVIPYGGTFLTFTDYCRPAIRLSALMGLRVIYVMTHDSIGLGEDGPTHQPVEHLAALRAIPNLNLFRPADAVETAECWEIALNSTATPSVIALTRQGLEQVRLDPHRDNPCVRGGYLLREAEAGKREITLLATGSEVVVALRARTALEQQGIGTAVASLPCLELFAAQDRSWRDTVLGRDTVRVAVEAGIGQGWDGLIGERGGFVGMNGFGASAPGNQLFDHFGITPAAVAGTALSLLGRNA
ncbi:MAG: transketolase [Alphaproteobacteria bacterium]|nr:transketolase [Alphaproteobacteria bacterium]